MASQRIFLAITQSAQSCLTLLHSGDHSIEQKTPMHIGQYAHWISGRAVRSEC